MSERKRSANWLMQEKLLLLDLVTDHFSIVENKKTDGVTMKQTIAEWAKISDEFNCQTTGGHRTAENLKAQWESLKKTTKKTASAARQSLLQTGGGPPKPEDSDPIYVKVMGLLNTAAVFLYNKFDSDNIIITIADETTENYVSQAEPAPAKVSVPDVSVILQPKWPINVEPVPSSSLNNNEMDSKPWMSQDWGDYTPKMLQAPMSSPLRFKEKENVSRAVEEIGNKTPHLKGKSWSSKRRPALPTPSTSLIEEIQRKKIRALDLQIEFAEAEREEAKKLFEINYEIQKEQYEIQKELLKQEKLKTRLLLKQIKKKNNTSI